MYISGQTYDFASRQHQLATGNSDLSNFLTEGRSYLSNISGARTYSGKWEAEARRIQIRMSGSGEGYNTNVF